MDQFLLVVLIAAGLLASLSCIGIVRELAFFGVPMARPHTEDLVESKSLGIRSDSQAFERRLTEQLDRDRAILLQKCKVDVRNQLSEMLEEFQATSAWLFIADNENGLIVPAVSQNACKEPIPVSATETKGIVAHVFREKLFYCAPDTTKDDIYFPEIDDTKSEAAVPIIGRDGILLGIINVESNRTGTFTPLSRKSLEVHATAMRPLVRLLFLAQKSPDNLPPWDYASDGWGFRPVLDRICSLISEHAPHKLRQPTCTIWEYDEPKNCLHAIGTAGFDLEYVHRLALPINSFLGSIAVGTFEEPSGTTGLKLDHISGFARREKAERMGIKSVAAVPIIDPYSGIRRGVLNVYFFEEDSPAMNKADLKFAASLVNGLLRQYRELVTVLASEYCEAQVQLESSNLDQAFEILRTSISNCLASTACSIFVRLKSDESDFLRCVATSGLELANGTPAYDFREVRYDLLNYDIQKPGLSRTLVKYPDQIFRKLSADDDTEFGAAGCPAIAANETRERFALTTSDTRRYLGGAVKSIKGQVVGIIRLNRAGTSSPFLQSDEKILASLTPLVADLIDRSKQEERYAAIFSGRRDVLTGVESLLSAPSPFDERGTRSGEKVLQMLLSAYDQRNAVTTGLWQVERGSGEKVTRSIALRAMHSLDSQNWQRYTREAAVFSEVAKLTEHCLDRSTVVTYHRSGVGRNSAVSGVWMPITLWSWTGDRKLFAAQWLINVEFLTRVEWDAAAFLPIQLATQKLSLILGATGKGMIANSPQSFLDGFFEEARSSIECKWLALDLRSRDGNYIPIRGTGGRPHHTDAVWRRAHGDLGDDGLEISESAPYSIRWPLRIGPVSVARLRCDELVFDVRGGELERRLDLPRVTSAWSLFPYYDFRGDAHNKVLVEMVRDSSVRIDIGPRNTEAHVWRGITKWDSEIIQRTFALIPQ